MNRLVVVLGLLAACGRIDFDALRGDGASGDAGTCLGTGTFTNVQPISAINTAAIQYGTFISPDGLTLLWDQSDGTYERLYVTQRAARTDAFPSGGLIPGNFPAAEQYDPSITADQLELYFDSEITGKLCLYRATRASTAVPFDPPVMLPTLCATDPIAGAAISADGLTLAYNTSLDAATEGDLYVTARADRSAEFPAGKKLNGLPTGIGFPALSADRLRLWFEEEIPGNGFKLVSAERISPSDDFSQLHDVTEIDTNGSEGDVSTLTNPIGLQRSGIRYHRAPPNLGADNREVRAWLQADSADPLGPN